MVTDTEILEATIFVLAYKPEATMEDIADRAGVTRITINRKFGGKQKLKEAAARHSLKIFDHIIRRAMSGKKPPMDKFFKIMREYYRVRHHYYFWMRTMIDEEDQNRKAFLKQLDKVEQLVVKAQERGEVKAHLPSGWVASFFDYIIITAANTRYRGVVAERDALQIAWHTFMYGVAPQKAF